MSLELSLPCRNDDTAVLVQVAQTVIGVVLIRHLEGLFHTHALGPRAKNSYSTKRRVGPRLLNECSMISMQFEWHSVHCKRRGTSPCKEERLASHRSSPVVWLGIHVRLKRCKEVFS